jgi:hypothetical protein
MPVLVFVSSVRVGAHAGRIQAQEHQEPGGTVPVPHRHPQRVSLSGCPASEALSLLGAGSTSECIMGVFIC